VPKINLIIADADESYLQGVTAYITEKQSSKFNVHSFSDKNHLEGFLSQNKKNDILLISPELFSDSFTEKGITLVAILSTGRLSREFLSYEIVNKYQLGDSLVSNILNLFSDKSTDIIVHSGETNTRVISVFSPIGGSGKTTIAYGSALKLAESGLKVFYLNFENIPSTPAFFETGSEFNLSHVFYYLKAKSKNLSLKIDGIRLEDAYSGIHYFNPPERLTDINDTKPEEYSMLINELKAMNCYDVIIIDTSPFLDKKNISILSDSDEILFIVTPEITSYTRTQQTIKELEFIYSSQKIDILSKSVPVLNKTYSGCVADIENMKIGQKEISIWIPKVSQLITTQSGRAFLNLNSIFGEALGAITSRFKY
jgi:cellulose biosynthesis protein BcsQ